MVKGVSIPKQKNQWLTLTLTMFCHLNLQIWCSWLQIKSINHILSHASSHACTTKHPAVFTCLRITITNLSVELRGKFPYIAVFMIFAYKFRLHNIFPPENILKSDTICLIVSPVEKITRGYTITEYINMSQIFLYVLLSLGSFLFL